MESQLKKTAGLIFGSKVWEILRNLFIVSCLFQCIFNLTEYDNAIYGTWKTIAEERALLAFILVLFIMAKVILVNWQSLAGTAAMVLVAVFRLRPLSESPDLLAIVKCELVSEWALLMIILDLIIYKKARNLFKGCNIMLIVYFLLTVGMLYRRNNRFEPIILVFPFALMMFIKITDDEWNMLIRRFVDGWFVTWCYVVYKSLTTNPPGIGRYYGSFLNLGPFGIFMACSLLMGVFALLYSKKSKGRLSFFYFASWLWILGILYFLTLIDTVTAYTGMAMMLIAAFLFLGEKSTPKRVAKRGIILALMIVAGMLVFVGLLYLLRNSDYDAASDYARWQNAGILSPFVGLYSRLTGAANQIEADTLPEMIFKALDIIASGRLTIARLYAPYFNFDGNGNITLMSGDYLVYNPHNNYVQFLTNYGYISALELIILAVLVIRFWVKKYLSEKNIYTALPILWIFLASGAWLGETNSLEYPVTFFAMIFVVRGVSIWEEKKNG